MPDPDERVFHGRHQTYKVECALGRGACASVYLAHESETGRPVAVKLMSAEMAAIRSAVRRFVAEAQTLSRLDHPHIVKILDIGLHDGRPILVMEYASRGTLAGFVSRHGPTSPGLAIDLMLQVTRAIEVVHQYGLIHRDIKPYNLLVADDGRALLADFGIVKRVAGRTTKTGLALGTIGYTAPEQLANAKAVTPASEDKKHYRLPVRTLPARRPVGERRERPGPSGTKGSPRTRCCDRSTVKDRAWGRTSLGTASSIGIWRP